MMSGDMPKTNSLLWLGLVGTVLLSAQDKPRVYVSAGESWAINDSGGGSRPQTVELMKNFRERCPEVTVTSDKSKADFAVVFDRQGGNSLVNRLNKIAVFDKSGDLIFTASTRALTNAVKDTCEAIKKVRADRK
jgi:hypothetical protein